MRTQSSPPLLASADVVVVGSGSAGSTAAIAAARTGASVLLIEKLPFLGGTSTAVLDTFYGFFTPGSQPRRIVGGIADDVVAALRRLGPVVERPNTYGAGTGITYNAEHLKLAWEHLVTGAGAQVLLHAFLQEVSVRDGRVEELLVATKARPPGPPPPWPPPGPAPATCPLPTCVLDSSPMARCSPSRRPCHRPEATPGGTRALRPHRPG